MSVYDLYRKKVSCDNTPSENLRSDIVRELTDTFFKSPSYHRVKLNDDEEDSHAHIVYDRKLDYNGDPNIQNIIMHPDYSINAGDYVHVYDWENNWIVPNVEGNKDIYQKGIMVLCGETWKWIDENDVIQEYPCAIYDQFSTTTGFMQKKNIVIPAGNITAFVQWNEDTSNIQLNQRMLFKGQAWVINKIQSIQQDGIIMFFMIKDLLQEDDDLENGVASTNKYIYNLDIYQESFEQSVGYTTQLDYTLTLNGIESDKEILWEVSNDNATIDENGNLELLQEGSVEVKAYMVDNDLIYDSINISITSIPNSVEYIITPEDLDIKSGRTKQFSIYRYDNNIQQNVEFNVSILNNLSEYDYNLNIIDGNNIEIECINANSEPLSLRFEEVGNPLSYVDYEFNLVGLW